MPTKSIRKKNRNFIFLMVLINLACCASFVCAEKVVLKSGKVFQGTIIAHDDSEFRLIADSGAVLVPYRMVKKIEADDANNTKPYQHFDEILAKVQKYNQQRTHTAAASEKSKKSYVHKRKTKQKYVEFYMTSWCPYCTKMEKFLKRMNVKYKKYNIEKNATAHKRYRSLGGRGVPVLKVGNKVIHGYNTQAARAALRKLGY